MHVLLMKGFEPSIHDIVLKVCVNLRVRGAIKKSLALLYMFPIVYRVTYNCDFPSRFDDLVESIESVLVPLLTQIPSPDLYELAPPTSSPSHTPHSNSAHVRTARLTKAKTDAIDNCKEEIPGYLEANKTTLDGSVNERLMKAMTACSQLELSNDFLEHKKIKVCGTRSA